MRRPSALALVALALGLTGATAYSATPCAIADPAGDVGAWIAVLEMPLEVEPNAPGAGGRGDLITLAMRAGDGDLVVTLGAHDLSAPRRQRANATNYDVTFNVDDEPYTVSAAEVEDEWRYYTSLNKVLGAGPRVADDGPVVEGAVDLGANRITIVVRDFFVNRGLVLTEIEGVAAEGIIAPVRDTVDWSQRAHSYTYDRIGGPPGGSQLPPSMDLASCG